MRLGFSHRSLRIPSPTEWSRPMPLPGTPQYEPTPIRPAGRARQGFGNRLADKLSPRRRFLLDLVAEGGVPEPGDLQGVNLVRGIDFSTSRVDGAWVIAATTDLATAGRPRHAP